MSSSGHLKVRSVALITGGASGIGRALGEALARRGVAVALCDRQSVLAAEVARAITQDGGTATSHDLDVRDLAAWREVVAEVMGAHGRIDYLFNNAGIGVGGDIASYKPEDWDDVFDVNLRGVAYGIQVVYPLMIAQRSGHIVNTASMAGLVVSPGNTSYSAAKHAVVAVSKALRIEAAEYGVRVSAFCPGAIRTSMLTGGKYGRLTFAGANAERLLKLWEVVRPMDVNVFAEKALDAVQRNEAIIVLPAWWRALWWIERVSPAVSLRVWSLIYARLQRDLAVGVTGVGRRAEETSEARSVD